MSNQTTLSPEVLQSFEELLTQARKKTAEYHQSKDVVHKAVDASINTAMRSIGESRRLKLTFSEDVDALLCEVAACVKRDIHRYARPKVIPPKPKDLSEKARQERFLKEEEQREEKKEHAHPEPESHPEDAPEEELPAFSFLTPTLERTRAILNDRAENSELVEQSALIHMDEAKKYLYYLCIYEAQNIQDNPKEAHCSATSLMKIHRVLKTTGAQRINESITILRQTRRDDPNNHIIAFLLSQHLYYMAYQGKSEYLPEAREEAKRSCLFGEEMEQKKLLRYRYHAITTEQYFSGERALELMRDYYMLNPEAVCSKEGFFTHDLQHLKTWFALGRVPPSHWGRFEAESLYEVSQKSIGGSVLYTYAFRAGILRELESGNDLFQNFNTLEEHMQEALLEHHALSEAVSSNFSTEGLPLKAPSKHMWLTPIRYLRLFLSVAPAPSVDEVLLHTSLDGRLYLADEALDDALHRRGLSENAFWRTWIAAMTPFRQYYMPSSLPVEGTAKQAAILGIYEELLSKLQACEKELIGKDNIEILRPHMPVYTWQNIMELGLRGREVRLKKDGFYAPYHRQWQKRVLNAPLLSEMLSDQATLGGFWNIDELHAALEGIFRVLTNTMHNPAAHIFRARMTLKQKGKATFGSAALEVKNSATSIVGVLVFTLLLSALTFLIVLSASSFAEGMQALLGIMGSVLLFGGVFMLIFKK